MRTYDLLAVADAVARQLPDLFSIEMWGGATFDTTMRFLQEDPWERLIELRKRIPNVLFQMLLRASNAVGYTSYPDNVVREFIRVSAQQRHRRLPDLRLAQRHRQHARGDGGRARRHHGAVRGGHLLHRRHPRPGPHQVQPRLLRAHGRELVAMGAHILAIKDMAGLCKPYAAQALVTALRNEVGVPIHFHTHDTSGVNAASVLLCGRRRRGHCRCRDRVDERHDQPAVPQLDRRRAAARRPRYRPRPGARSSA